MDNMFWLGGRLYRVDYSVAEPPWPLLVWDQPSLSWQVVAASPAPPDIDSGPGMSGGHIYAPLCSGDLPGPVFVADGQGQCIMVPIT